ncbi:MAG TPA: hypothetical protein P5123_10985 [Spirochaetota bacterium]|nr:hypothetical protein [Spirochaetota bacterium]
MNVDDACKVKLASKPSNLTVKMMANNDVAEIELPDQSFSVGYSEYEFNIVLPSEYISIYVENNSSYSINKFWYANFTCPENDEWTGSIEYDNDIDPGYWLWIGFFKRENIKAVAFTHTSDHSYDWKYDFFETDPDEYGAYVHLFRLN